MGGLSATGGLHVTELRAHRDLPAGHPMRGRSDHPPVVLVHGSLDRSTSFSRTARRLSDLDVVLYDRRGYNRSRALSPLAADIETHVEDLLAVIDGRSVAVVGHSLGGLVALAAAWTDPGVVKAVGAYEAPLPWFDWWPRRAKGPITEDPADYARSFFERLVGEGAWERLNETARHDRRADGPALVAELTAIRQNPAPLVLDEISVPTFAARGSNSLDHHRRAAHAVADLVPGARLIELEGASHGAHLAHPDAFSDFVRLVADAARDEIRASGSAGPTGSAGAG